MTRCELVPAMASAELIELLRLLWCCGKAKRRQEMEMQEQRGHGRTLGSEVPCCSSTWHGRAAQRRRAAPRGGEILNRSGTVAFEFFVSVLNGAD